MKLTKRKMTLISFMLFSLFFGAGNLIFPPFLGQNAGDHLVSAMVGFLATAVILPVLGVIVVAEFDGLDGERAVVAPPGEIFYEPELRKLLSRLKNVKLKSITCLYEKSCGAIIFYKTKQNTKILLVKNSNGRYWSFPKGHIEEGENEQQTAIREIKEETGLDVTLFNGFREISEYCPFGKIRKRVVFFLAQAFTDNVKIQEEEIDSYIWVDLQQARKMCSYDNDLRIIEKAETAIHLMRN